MRIKCIGICLLCLMLTGCSSTNFGSVYNKDRKIASSTNSYNLTDYEQHLEDNHLMASGKFEGADTIWTIDAKDDDEVHVTYALATHSGRAKLVFIDPDGTVSVIAESFEDAAGLTPSTISYTLQQGEYRIKLVGDQDTEMELDISVTAGALQEL